MNPSQSAKQDDNMQPQNGQGVVPPVQQMPASTPNKEGSPVATHLSQTPVVEAPVGNYVAPSEQEPVLHPDVAASGVEVAINHEQPQISPDVQQLGVTHAGPTQSVNIPQTSATVLPMQQAQATQIAKKKKWHESITWLAIFILRQFKLLHEKQQKGEEVA